MTITTHLLTPTGLTGNLIDDRRMVLEALQQGHAFIGYDLPEPTASLAVLSRRVAAEGVDDAVVARNARRRARTKQPKESK